MIIPTPTPPSARSCASAASVKGDRKHSEITMIRPTERALGAGWFFIVALCTVMNSFLLLTERVVEFYGGFFVTQILDALALGLSTLEPEGVLRPTFPQLAAFSIDVGFAGTFAVLGVCALLGKKWAFRVGLISYGVDTALFFSLNLLVVGYLSTKQWVVGGAHVLGLLLMYRGMALLSRAEVRS